MNSGSNTNLLCSARDQLGKSILVLMLVQSLVMGILAWFWPSCQSGYLNTACGLVLLAVSAYVFSQEKPLWWRPYLLSTALVLTASLLVSCLSASSLVFASHYAQVLALGVIALYRNRALTLFAASILIIEQSVRSFLVPGSIFAIPVQHDLVIEHICWLIASSAVFCLLCQSANGGEKTEDPPVSSGAPAGAALEKKALAVETMSASAAEKAAGFAGIDGKSSQTLRADGKPASPVATAAVDGKASAGSAVLPADGKSPDGELIACATEVGARAKKLHRAITNLEGPIKRMALSINGANRGMQEIKDELSRTATSVIQITENSQMHANKAAEVFRAAEEAAAGSQIGAQSTEESIANMDHIRKQMDLIAKSMDNLLTRSQKMVQVVGFADELALQSKVLSVNAAIEAAKAGDRGQGFTAVATEVKSLANQSKEATREVRLILKEIQKSIADVRGSIALGNETVDLASKQCRSTADSIKGLDSSVNSSRDAAETIMVSSKDQVQGIMQISRAMNDIQTVSEQNSGSLGNLQVEAQKLNAIARELVNDMKSYQSLIDQLQAKCAVLKEQEPQS